MAENSAIAWTNHTFNPWIGCRKTASPGCRHCYAQEREAKRWGWTDFFGTDRRHRTAAGNWAKPRRWDRQAREEGKRVAVFCGSLCDILDNEVPVAWRNDLFDLIEATPNIDWLLLSKRWATERDWLPEQWMVEGFPKHVWPGLSVCGAQDTRWLANFLRLPAVGRRFLSMEPLVEEVDIVKAVDEAWMEITGATGPSLLGISGIITGGESGDEARPSNPQWFRIVRDACLAAGVDYCHKQNGEWASVSEVEGPGEHYTFPDHRTVRRVGAKNSGRTLDGEIHDALPWRR